MCVNGRIDTHKLCRQKLIDILETYDFTDIWRNKHPFLKQYTWHSFHKLPILCRLDYLLISKSITNIVIPCEHKISYKSDHSIVTVSIVSNIYNRGPGYFKLNNSLLLDGEYQQKIKDNISYIARIIKDANPNTLWEIIKGTIRNETIKYASLKKKRNIQIEENHTKEIQRLEIELTSSDDPLQNERLKQEIDNKRKELETIMENKLNGYITRSQAQIIEQNEKKTKYFASLERKNLNPKSYLV